MRSIKNEKKTKELKNYILLVASMVTMIIEG